jgi:tape measure domain-containing protein
VASFDANINLDVVVSGLEKAQRKVQQAVAKLEQNKIDFGFKSIDTSNLSRVDKTLTSISRTAQRAKAALGGLAVGTGLAAGTDALNQLGQALQKTGVSVEVFGKQFNASIPGINSLGDALRSVTGWIEPLDNAFRSAGAAGAEWAAAAALGTAATVAFAPQIQALGEKFRLVEKAALAVLPRIKDFEVNFSSAERKIRASTDVISELRESLRIIDRELDRTNTQTEEAADMAGARARVERRLNLELERQATLLRNAARAQREFNDQARVRQNVAASRSARGGSGFGEFSQAASVADNQNAIDKAIRRNRANRLRKPKTPIEEGPLALPSTEILNATERGIKRIATSEEKLAEAVARTRREQESAIIAQQKRNKEAERLAQFQSKALPAGAPSAEEFQRKAAAASAQRAAIAQSIANKSGAAVVTQTKLRLQLANQINKAAQAEVATYEKNVANQKRLNQLLAEGAKIRESYKQDRFARRAQQQQRAQRFGGALSNAAVGAAFPLLFGQSGGAATGGAIGGLLGSIAGPTGGFAGSLIGTVIGEAKDAEKAVADLGKELGLTVDQAEQLQNAFKLAGRDADKFAAAVQGTRGIGLDPTDQFESIKLFSKLADSFDGKIDKIANGFNKIATAGKASFADIARLAGQGIPIFDELEKSLGVNRTQLLQLAKDGEISAQQVVDSLIRIANAAENNAEKTKGPWERAWDNIVEGVKLSYGAINAVLGALLGSTGDTAGGIAEQFSELYKGLVVGAIQAAKRIARAFADLSKGLKGYFDFFAQIGQAGGLLDIATKPAQGVSAALGEIGRIADQIDKIPEEIVIDVAPIEGISLPGVGPRSGGGGGGRGRSTKERESQVPALQRELALREKLFELETKIGDAELRKDQNTVIRLQGEQELARLAKERLDILAEDIPQAEKALKLKILETDELSAQLKTRQELAKLEQQRVENIANIKQPIQDEIALLQGKLDGNEKEIKQKQEIRDLAKQLKEQEVENADAVAAALIKERDLLREKVDAYMKLQEALKQISQRVGTAIEDSIVAAIDSAVDSTKDLGQALQEIASSLLKDIGRMLIRGGIQAAGSGLNLPGFAAGGRPEVGRMSLVGENGPELFVPDQRGTVVGSNAFDAAKQAMVTSSSVQSSTAALDREQEQVEMMNNPSPLDVRFETYSIGGMDVVTREEAMKISEQSAKKARAQVFADMRNKPATRAQLGIG